MGAGGPGQHYLWLDPEIPGDASVNIDWYIEQARLAEAAKFDLIFIVDSQFITADSPPHYLNRLEPMTLLSALAVSTRHLGLVATMTTSYNDPFNLARRLAVAGPDQRRPVRLERRHQRRRGRGGQLQPRGALRLRHPLRPRPGVRPGRPGPVGLLRGRTRSPATAGRAGSSTRPAARAPPPGRALPVAGPAQHLPLAAGPAGHLPGRRLRAGPRPGRDHRRGHLHPRAVDRAGPGVLRRHQGPRRGQGPRPRPHHRHARRPGLRRRHRRRGPGDRARPAAGRPGLRPRAGRARPPVRLARLPPVRPGRAVPATSLHAAERGFRTQAREDRQAGPGQRLHAPADGASSSPRPSRPRSSAPRIRSRTRSSGGSTAAPSTGPTSTSATPPSSAGSSTRWCPSCANAASSAPSTSRHAARQPGHPGAGESAYPGPPSR